MNNQDEVIRIHEFIINDEMFKALELLEKLDKGDLQIEIINLKARINEVQKNDTLNIVDKKELDIERNKIRVSTLNLAQKLNLSNKEINNESKKHKEIQFFRDILKVLEISQATFQAQKKVRLKLVELLQERIGKLEYDNIPDLLSNYYDKMNPKELRLHKVIKGYTDNIIKEQNFDTLKLIQSNPEFINKIERLEYLEMHLILWKSKYKSLSNDESICLIYVGNDEKMRFPIGIEDEIRNYIKQLVEE